MVLLKILSFGLITISIFVFAVTVFGLIRMKDNYIQIHVAGMADMFAFPVFMLGVGFLFLSEYDLRAFIKILAIILIFYIVNPIINYCIIKITYFYSNKKVKNNTKMQ